MEGSG